MWGKEIYFPIATIRTFDQLGSEDRIHELMQAIWSAQRGRNPKKAIWMVKGSKRMNIAVSVCLINVCISMVFIVSRSSDHWKQMKNLQSLGVLRMIFPILRAMKVGAKRREGGIDGGVDFAETTSGTKEAEASPVPWPLLLLRRQKLLLPTSPISSDLSRPAYQGEQNRRSCHWLFFVYPTICW